MAAQSCDFAVQISHNRRFVDITENGFVRRTSGVHGFFRRRIGAPPIVQLANYMFRTGNSIGESLVDAIARQGFNETGCISRIQNPGMR